MSDMESSSLKTTDHAEAHISQFADAKTRRLANAIPSMVWTSGSDGYADYFNEQWYLLTGQSPEEAVGRGWMDTIHADDRERVMSAWESAIDSGDDFEIELRYRMANKRYNWHLVRAVPVCDEAGNIDYWFVVSTDINDKHESEEVSEAMALAMFEAVVDGIVTFDDRGIIQSCNPATERLFDYTKSEVVGQNITMLMPEYIRGKYTQYLASFLETGVPKIIDFGREVEGSRKDGSVFAMELSVSEVKLKGQRLFTAIVRDITNRQRLESEVSGQALVLERLAQGDSICDVLKTLVEVVEESRPEMIGAVMLLDEQAGRLRHEASTSLPDYYIKALDGVEPGHEVGSCGMAAFTGQRVIAEDINTHPIWEKYRALAKRAGLHSCWSEPIVSSTGLVLGTFAMYYQEPRAPSEIDLESASNAAKLAAMAVERLQSLDSLRQMAAIVESTDDAIILKNLDGVIESWNKGAERIYGYSSAEAIGQSVEMLVPDDRLEELHTNMEKIRLGEKVDHFETIRVTKAGQRIHVSLTISPVRDEDGKLVHFVDVQNDITNLMKSAEKLVQSERLAAMGQMMSSIAHESRNALQRIQAGVDMLKLDIPVDSVAGRDLSQIGEARADLQTLLDGLRDFAAPVVLDLQACNLADVWQQTWRNLDCSKVNRQVELVEQTQDVDLRCTIDSFRIEQIFRNLIENSLAACTDPVQIKISCSDSELNSVPAVSISVRDNGPGLTQEQLDRIFEAFYTTKPKGTGLGMAIAMKTIQAHHGTLVAGNGSGGGAEFIFKLPREQS